MSKIIRKFRQEKKKNRIGREYTKLRYPSVDKAAEGTILDLVHERGKGAPYAVVEIEDKTYNIPATEGMSVGDKFQIGDKTEVKTGNITKIKNIPEGTYVNSVEYAYNDGGHMAMNAGGFCIVVNHHRETNQTILKLPSGQKKTISSDVRAIIGIVASAGITFKPLMKASNVHYLRKARGQLFPRVRGVAMNPVDHPHGGGNHQHIGFPCTIARSAPYAQQVGLVAASRTGRRTGSKNSGNK